MIRMTAKRWEIIDEEFISYAGGSAQLNSNGECEIHLWERPKDAQLFCDKLNALNEDIEQLKQIIYDDESQIIGEWSSNIQEDMKELNEAYESDDINDLIRFCKDG